MIQENGEQKFDRRELFNRFKYPLITASAFVLYGTALYTIPPYIWEQQAKREAEEIVRVTGKFINFGNEISDTPEIARFIIRQPSPFRGNEVDFRRSFDVGSSVIHPGAREYTGARVYARLITIYNGSNKTKFNNEIEVNTGSLKIKGGDFILLLDKNGSRVDPKGNSLADGELPYYFSRALVSGYYR